MCQLWIFNKAVFRKQRCSGNTDVNQTTSTLIFLKPEKLWKNLGLSKSVKIWDGEIALTGDFSRCQEVSQNPLSLVIQDRLTSSLALCTNASTKRPADIQDILEKFSSKIVGEYSRNFRTSLVGVRERTVPCDHTVPNAYTILLLENYDKMICPPLVPFIDTSFLSTDSCSQLPLIEKYLAEEGAEISVSLLGSKAWIMEWFLVDAFSIQIKTS